MTLLIIAGEPSGDLHASNLVRQLRRLDGRLKFFGLGGKLMKDAGVDTLHDISGLALVGLAEVLKKIFLVGGVYRDILSAVDARRPDAAILVDYPGFNLRLAKELKKRSIPVIYYISPQIWAWGADRIKIIKNCIKKMIVFFRFEEELYKKNGVDAEFVGHPLIDTVRVEKSRNEVLKAYRLSPDKKTVALLAGSRAIEVERLLGILASAAGLINKGRGGVQFLVSKHPQLERRLYDSALKNLKSDFAIAEGEPYDILAASDLAIVASGTATLETAIIGTPLIVVYRVSPLTHILYKMVARMPFLGLPNVVAGRKIVPEILQYNATPAKIAAKAIELLGDKARLSLIRTELARVKASLGSPGATERAASAILKLLQ